MHSAPSDRSFVSNRNDFYLQWRDWLLLSINPGIAFFHFFSSHFFAPSSLPFSLSFLFIRSIYSKAKRFRPASEKVYMPPLSPNSEAFSSWISLFAIFFDRLSPPPPPPVLIPSHAKLTLKRILLPFRVVFATFNNWSFIDSSRL